MITQPRIEKQQDECWITRYPDGIEPYLDIYYDSLELMDVDPKRAEKGFKKIIAACGNRYLDAILHLGLLFNDTDREIEGNALVFKAYRIAMDAFPAKFKPGTDQLHWSDLENRPILRAIHSYGLELMKLKDFDAAIRVFEFILKVNPGDNQGVRYLLLDCLFHLERPAEVLKFCKRIGDDYSVEFLYSKVLALFLLDRKKEAAQQLGKARKAFPFVAKELVKKRHVFPADEFELSYDTKYYGYPIGSRQQAFDYWMSTKLFWERAEGIKDFIEKAS